MFISTVFCLFSCVGKVLVWLFFSQWKIRGLYFVLSKQHQGHASINAMLLSLFFFEVNFSIISWFLQARSVAHSPTFGLPPVKKKNWVNSL